jgi:hypothetical protein
MIHWKGPSNEGLGKHRRRTRRGTMLRQPGVAFQYRSASHISVPALCIQRMVGDDPHPSLK